MESEHNRVKGVLIDTISLLCKSSLTYSNQLKIEGVIGITVDGCIFLVHVDQQFGPNDDDDEAIQSCLEVNTGTRIKSEPIEIPEVFQNPTKASLSKQPKDKNSSVFVKQEPKQIKQEPQDTFTTPVKRKKPRTELLQKIVAMENEEVNTISLIDDYVEDEQAYGVEESFDESYNPNYQIQEEASEDWCYEPRRKTAKSRSRGGSRRGRFSGNSRRTSSYEHHDGTSLVITESSHICGYPNCFKRFKFRHDLLRHQTRKHGRKPAFTRARMSNVVQSNRDHYYYEDEDGNFDASNDGDGSYEYGDGYQ